MLFCLCVPQTDERAAHRINSQVCQVWRCIDNCFVSNDSQQRNVSVCQGVAINRTMLQGASARPPCTAPQSRVGIIDASDGRRGLSL